MNGNFRNVLNEDMIRRDALQRLIEENETRRMVENIPFSRSLGQYGRGNIDLYNRPQYMQPNGAVSTVNSISFGDDEGEILVPTIAYDDYGMPKQLTEDEAIDRYYRTGEYLGKFNTVDEANDYADRLHRQQEAYYGARR